MRGVNLLGEGEGGKLIKYPNLLTPRPPLFETFFEWLGLDLGMGSLEFLNLFWTNLKTHSLTYEECKILCNNYFPWKKWEKRGNLKLKKNLYT